MKGNSFWGTLLAAFFLMTGLACGASSDEIQVYDDAINPPGEFGLEIHANYTAEGAREPAYPGDLSSHHLLRVTPEFSYGLTRIFEAGLYLPLALDGEGNFYGDGAKIRLKYIPGLESDRYFLGLNLELGRVSKRLEESHWNTELRPILGFRHAPFLVAFNPILGWSFSGGHSWQYPTFEPAIKVRFDIVEGIGIGVEHYADLGQIDRILPLDEQGHTLYGVIDVSKGLLDLNFGVGRGLTKSVDDWIIKAIISVPLPQ